jgi:hypothetical protein
MFDYYSLETMATEQQRAIRAEVATQRQQPFAHAVGLRRALAAALAALAHRLDPYGVGQSLQAVPARQR